jgi:hypothetical protein
MPKGTPVTDVMVTDSKVAVMPLPGSTTVAGR